MNPGLNPNKNSPFTRLRYGGLFASILVILTIGIFWNNAQQSTHLSFTPVKLPLANGAREPSLYPLSDGRIMMSWMEPLAKGFTVKTAIGGKAGWDEPTSVVQSENLYINWADFPSLAMLPDGTQAVHWLKKNGPSTYNYDVNIALSSNDGKSWGDVIVPHNDQTTRQHGFVSLLPVSNDTLLTFWLDARKYNPDAAGEEENAFTNAMQLRVATINSDGSKSNETLLDERTCTCCQTSAASTNNGTIIVAYRDRTAKEIRDISIIRQVNGTWSKPKSINADGWEINGCPVNGPAIATQNENVVVAWYTAAKDKPAVKIAFSNNAGELFAPAIRIDKGDADGRVDAVTLKDGSALVSWVKLTDEGEALMLCRVSPEYGCDTPQIITHSKASGGINFPRMTLAGNYIYIAWTQPLETNSRNSDLDVTIKMVYAGI